MRLLYVVQRYGEDVAGGAEGACRDFAEHSALRGHDVAVVTTTAKSYVDWAPHYAPGDETINDVTVRRFDVQAPREDKYFGPLYARTVWGPRPIALYLQEEWMRCQGPFAPDLASWISDNAASYDVVIFFTYLYWTTWAGLSAAAGKTAVVLHPLAHDEPPLRQQLFRLAFRLPDAIAYATEEEQDVVQQALGVQKPSRVIGIGVNLDQQGSRDKMREAFPELGDRPYVLFLGRVDPGKGSDEIYDFFVEYKARNPGPLALVVMGDPVKPLDPHPDVFVTGFVAEEMKYHALDGCELLVQPSYFESFSIVLCEAWLAGKAALVNGHCEVLVGQCRRSGGGLPYRDFAEFETALEMLLADPDLRDRMGAGGRDYVNDRYDWNAIMDRYDTFLAMTARTQWPEASARRPA